MKLVDILARELKEWPQGARLILHDGANGCYADLGITSIDVGIDCSEFDGNPANAVFEAGWQVAVDALKSYDDEMAIKKAAHEALVWNGKGLPPVGVFCECRVVSGSEWLKCEIVAHKTHDLSVYAIAFVDENTVMLSGGIRFRPIRTPEQIAAEERDKAIDNMIGVVNAGFFDNTRAIYGALYDAGYRKFEIVDN